VHLVSFLVLAIDDKCIIELYNWQCIQSLAQVQLMRSISLQAWCTWRSNGDPLKSWRLKMVSRFIYIHFRFEIEYRKHRTIERGTLFCVCWCLSAHLIKGYLERDTHTISHTRGINTGKHLSETVKFGLSELNFGFVRNGSDRPAVLLLTQFQRLGFSVLSVQSSKSPDRWAVDQLVIETVAILFGVSEIMFGVYDLSMTFG